MAIRVEITDITKPDRMNPHERILYVAGVKRIAHYTIQEFVSDWTDELTFLFGGKIERISQRILGLGLNYIDGADPSDGLERQELTKFGFNIQL